MYSAWIHNWNYCYGFIVIEVSLGGFWLYFLLIVSCQRINSAAMPEKAPSALHSLIPIPVVSCVAFWLSGHFFW